MSDVISQNTIELYKLLRPLLNGIYVEVQELSKKKPDTPLNNFKIRSINRILEPIKDLLKEENTLTFLDILDTDDVPTNSDVVLILNHYMKAMDLFYNRYTKADIVGHKWNLE